VASRPPLQLQAGPLASNRHDRVPVANARGVLAGALEVPCVSAVWRVSHEKREKKMAILAVSEQNQTRDEAGIIPSRSGDCVA
jgi:hypothetical protein